MIRNVHHREALLRRKIILPKKYYPKNGVFRGYSLLAFSFALMQKKQKIKDNPIAPRVCPACARQKPLGEYFFLFEKV